MKQKNKAAQQLGKMSWLARTKKYGKNIGQEMRRRSKFRIYEKKLDKMGKSYPLANDSKVG